MKQKLIIVMMKLMKTSMNHYQVWVCYNIYILISMYFRYEIIDLNKKEEVELMRICKQSLL